MHRTLISLVLAGLLMGCSAKGDGAGGGPVGFDSQQPPNSGQQPVSASQSPTLPSESPPNSGQPPPKMCEGFTSAERYVLLLGEVACQKAAACGQQVPDLTVQIRLPPPVDGQQPPDGQPPGPTYQVEQEPGFWVWVCAAVELCRQYPGECQDGDFGAVELDVCPEQVSACFQAVMDQVGCEPTDEQLEQVEQSLPAACIGVLDQEPEPEPVEYGEIQPGDPYEGVAGATSA